MAIDYNNYLTDDQKANIITQRLQQFAGEAYQHEINKKVAEDNNDNDLVKQSTDAIQAINKAIAVHESELATLTLTQPDTE